MKLRAHSLSRNIATNSASYVITIAAAFIMYPVMIHRLGLARYGLWMLISELTGYYSYVGIGLRAGVQYYAALYTAQDDREELNRTMSTSIWSLTGLGVALAFAGFGLAAIFPVIFAPTGLDPRETSRSIVFMATALGLSLPVEAMNSALTAVKRLDVVNAMEMASRSIGSFAMLVCVINGGGLVALSLIQLVMRMLVGPCTWVAMRRTMPGVKLSLRYWSHDHLRRLARFGLPTVLIGLGWIVSSRTDLMIIGAVLGIPMVSFYAIPRSLMEYADAGIRAIAWSFTPHVTHLHAQGKNNDVVSLYLRGARLAGAAAFLLTACIGVFGPPFLALWQGAEFVGGPWQNRAGVVLLILLAAFLPRLIHNMTTQLFYGTNQLGFLMRISLLEGVVKVVLSLALVKPFGLAGIAVSNLIPMLLFEGLAIPLYLFRTYSVNAGVYFRDVFARSALAGGVACLTGAGLVFRFPPLHWPSLLLEAAVSALAGLLCAAAIGVSGAERKALWRQIARVS